METVLSVIFGVILAYAAIVAISRTIKKVASGECSCCGGCKPNSCGCAHKKHWERNTDKRGN